MKASKKALKPTYLCLCLTSLFIANTVHADELIEPSVAQTNDSIEVLKVLGARQAYRGNFTSFETP